MRFRSGILFFLPALVVACEPALKPGPRVNFINSTRFNAAPRRLTTPGDTIPIKVYAEAQDKDGGQLQRLVIKATYIPEARPIIYGPLYNEKDAPRSELTYLDTVISTNQFAFQSTQPARTTAGREEWRYEVTDSESRTGTSSFFMRLGRPDSAAAYHSYTITLQAPAPGDVSRRSFLALREGLALPKFTVRTLAANQELIDVVYAPVAATGAPTLATTTNTALALNWASPRRTELRQTSLDSTAFNATTSAAALTAAFPATAPNLTSTGPITRGQIIAFHTPDDKYGLIRVQRILTTTRVRAIVLQVAVTK